ncbi:MAG: S8 family serine peptidase [Candidatus Methanoperedens sp.]|nr:S8 family serine peptidase [Candidatus Methanoperedens sp.]
MKTNRSILARIVFLIYFSSILLTNVNAVTDKTSMDVKSKILEKDRIKIIVMLKDRSSFQTLSKANGVPNLKDISIVNQKNIVVLLNEEKKRNKADKIKQFWIVNAIAVDASPEVIEQLSTREDVERIELDSKVYIFEDHSAQVSRGQIDAATNDIKRIKAMQAWQMGIDGTGINVSVIDTGIYATHPDISGRVIKWIDFIGNLSSPYDDNGHGTHVAGTVGGNGAGGITTGVAPNVSLFGAKVLNFQGDGDSSDVISAIEWSIENQADIISMSIGTAKTWTTTNCDNDNLALTAAINNAISAGIVVAGASGNDPGGVSSPGCISGTIAVGAVYSSDTITYFSGRGSAMLDHGVVAHGYDITSLDYLTFGYISFSGTSMATPHVSGTVALMLQNARHHNITLTPLKIKNILANTSLDLGTPGKDNIYGWGRIDAYNATMFITDSPSVIVNPTEYQSSQAAKNGSIVTFNITISDNYGVKNASVNVSAINNSVSKINLTYFEGYWKGNVTIEAIDGIYQLNVTAYDLSNNVNNSTQINISIDNTPPLVSDLSVSSAFINLTDSINITANITSSDSVSLVNKSELFARVTYPNGSSIDFNLSQEGYSHFYKNFTDTTQYGRYNVTIFANDTTGNRNSSQITYFIATYMTKYMVNIPGGITETYTGTYSNTSLLLNLINSSNGTINISRSTLNMTSIVPSVMHPEIFVFVNASESLRTNLSYVIIRVNYTDEEVVSYVESSLRLSRWNISSSGWDKLTGSGSYPYVNDAGVDTDNNFVWANLTCLSEFTITGDLYVAPVIQSQGSGGGGGGGGGGGASGEKYSNIEVTEKYDRLIYKDKVTSYSFTNSSNPVVFVNIIGHVNFGEITTSVEVLRNTSTMVTTGPPGIIYKSMNIWAGTSSFNSPRNIKKGTIRFRVLNTWIKEKNFESIRMVQWNKSDWEYLETNEFSKDDEFTYYDAFTQVFSNFAIIGTEKMPLKNYGVDNQRETERQEVVPVSLDDPIPSKQSTSSIEQVETTNKNPGFGSILTIICLSGIYIWRLKK